VIVVVVSANWPCVGLPQAPCTLGLTPVPSFSPSLCVCVASDAARVQAGEASASPSPPAASTLLAPSPPRPQAPAPAPDPLATSGIEVGLHVSPCTLTHL
jgi:hypothetical protein